MKATFTLENAIDKTLQFLVLIPAVIWIMNPYVAQASLSLHSAGEATQVFEVKNLPKPTSENSDQTTQSNTTPSLAYTTVMANDVDYQAKLAYKEQLRNYLAQRGSPLANCVDILVELKNGPKILALANAESGLGRHYIPAMNNLWGVGGGYWKMGNTVCEGVLSMDNFLNAYPRNRAVKYADMSIDDMNGLYKQPRAAHWANNNYKILNDLQKLQDQSHQLAIAKISTPTTPVMTATIDAQLVK